MRPGPGSSGGDFEGITLYRSSIIFLLILAAMCGGVAAWVFASSNPIDLPGIGPLPARVLLAGGLLLLAGAAGAAATLAMSRAARNLARQLAEAGQRTSRRVEAAHPDLRPLEHAINSELDSAAAAMSSAQLRMKELEIQLKVATAERQHAEAIIYSISDAVLVTDPFDEVVLANDSAARTFNFALDGSTRTPIQKVLHDPTMVSLIQEMRQSDSRGGRRIVEHKVQTTTGERTYKVTLSCVSSRGEAPAGVVVVLHDMTREKEVADMKNQFVSSVSHELRTPLASIKAYTEMLIDGEAADEKTRQEFFEIIHNEANRLGRLIDNILNISRIESGLIRINKRPMSIMVVLKEAVDVIAPQAKQKRITLVEEISPAIYQTVGDRDMLYESILNLLSNAVKYTPEGGKVTVQTVVDEARKKIAVRISDTGVGIPPKDLPFVFDKFFRSEANSRMAKGTGLGLSLVKHIIEAVHHGRVLVESEVGKGSIFGFELDLVE